MTAIGHVPWEEPRREFGVPSSPAQVLDERQDRLDGRMIAAVHCVEEAMTRQIVNRDERRHVEVGFAARPLGGSAAWIDEAVLPYVREVYEERGWKTELSGHTLILTAPEEDA